jgi:hypothetical protein
MRSIRSSGGREYGRPGAAFLFTSRNRGVDCVLRQATGGSESALIEFLLLPFEQNPTNERNNDRDENCEGDRSFQGGLSEAEIN